MSVNAPLVEGIASSRTTLTADETALVEALRTHPDFGRLDKKQFDRHTLTNLFSRISDKPISVCAAAASKCERLIEAGDWTTDLRTPKALVESKKRVRKEAKEVPEERPASKDGDGELPQGDAETVAADHEGADVGKLAKDSPAGDADKGASQDKETQGDKSDTDKEGYIKEEDDEDELPVEEEADDLDPQLGEEEEGDEPTEENIDTENPDDAGKAAQDLPEQDVAPLAPPAAAPAPAQKAEKKVKKESEDDDEDDFEDGMEEAEEAPKDAKDPANDDKDRAANDATYRDGAKQNEAKKALKEDDLDQPNQTKDAEDLPDLDKVQKEDPSGSELNKGPADVALESLSWIEKRIHGILREAGLKQGSRRWTEAYLKGWSLAMEQRVRRLSEGK
jgi:hypothetical protein